MRLIEAHGVAKRYRRTASGLPRSLRNLGRRGPSTVHWALHDVSFTVGPGEAVGLIGANGSGKSTLLRLAAGLTRPTRGTITVRGRANGLVSLGEGLDPLLTAEENALTGAILAGLTRRQALQRMDAVAAFAELEEYMDQPLRTFSDGMRLRLAFATALAVDPEVLLVDEALAVGDLRFQQKCLDRLEELRAAGVALMLASHDLNAVRQLCERAVWLAGGEQRAIGHADEVLDRYENAVHEGFMAAPHTNGAGLRLGSREVEVTGVRLLNSGGMATSRITAGGPLFVEIDYVAHHPVADAIFGVSVHSEDGGIRCLDLSTAGDGHRVGPLDGGGTVALQLDRVDLAGGRYHVDVGVYEAGWSRPYDYLWQALPLEVAGVGTSGVLGPPRRWRMS